MKNHKRNGFALISVLFFTLALFALIALAVSANCHLHFQNRRAMEKLQEKTK